MQTVARGVATRVAVPQRGPNPCANLGRGTRIATSRIRTSGSGFAAGGGAEQDLSDVSKEELVRQLEASKRATRRARREERRKLAPIYNQLELAIIWVVITVTVAVASTLKLTEVLGLVQLMEVLGLVAAFQAAWRISAAAEQAQQTGVFTARRWIWCCMLHLSRRARQLVRHLRVVCDAQP